MVDGRQRYVLLTVGQEALHRDGAPLTWEDIFPFLWSQYLQHKNAAFVGFCLGYDFNHWFSTLPEERARMMLTKEGQAARKRKVRPELGPFPVEVGDWEIDTLGMKRFRLRPKGKKGWISICDVGPFFQQSLLSVIGQEWASPICTPEEERIIREGKSGRGDMTFSPDMIRYNALENEVLSRIMVQMEDGFKAMGVYLKKSQWFGPGQVASAWLTNVECPPREALEVITPVWARKAGQAAYYGGRFEIARHGIIPGATWEYDINSAYPDAIRQLPCLLHGKWSKGKGPTHPDGRWQIWHVVTRGSRQLGGLPHRAKDYTICYPQQVRGWYWRHEIEAAAEAGLIDSYSILDWVQYDACPCEPPLRSVEDLYHDRQRVGKNSPHGKALKIAYNSAYGKLAESASFKPKYANPIWASLITSLCRTKLMEAVKSHPNGVEDAVMFATDAVYFRSPHPSLPLSSELGEWEEDTHEDLTLALPGVYWNAKTRQAITDGNSPKVKSRGVPYRALAHAIGDLDRQFRSWDPESDPWPSARLHVDFSIVSCLLAIRRNDWNQAAYSPPEGVDRVLNTRPVGKRVPDLFGEWERGAWASAPVPYVGTPGKGPMESTPYDGTFGDKFIMDDLDSVLLDGGVAGDEVLEMLDILRAG